MRTILIIGVGAGDPDHLTFQAASAIGTVDVFFVIDKGAEKADLIALRQLILSRHAAPGHRVVEFTDPPRARAAPDYVAAVDDWRHRRADLLAALLRDELADGQRGALLVWGDPALYDSTLAVVADVEARGDIAVNVEMLPGISSVSTLAARHRIPLNRVGRPFLVTTGRRLAEGLPDGIDDVVVMLDAHCAFRHYADQDIDIYWGAYLGTADEILIAGPVGQVADRIVAARQAARDHKGWIMDTYLLRRH